MKPQLDRVICLIPPRISRHQLGVTQLAPPSGIDCSAYSRTMNDMWDEEWTEVCRQKFINRMYKFPTNPTFTLNTGAKMPVLGFGTWKNQQVSNVVQRALRRGLRSSPHSPCRTFYAPLKCCIQRSYLDLVGLLRDLDSAFVLDHVPAGTQAAAELSFALIQFYGMRSDTLELQYCRSAGILTVRHSLTMRRKLARPWPKSWETGL